MKSGLEVTDRCAGQVTFAGLVGRENRDVVPGEDSPRSQASTSRLPRLTVCPMGWLCVAVAISDRTYLWQRAEWIEHDARLCRVAGVASAGGVIYALSVELRHDTHAGHRLGTPSPRRIPHR